MSLGPPFDQSGERHQLVVGALSVVLISVAVGMAILASDRTLGDALTLRVRVRSPGSLHTGAQVRLAGQQIGEVVAIRDRSLSQRGGASDNGNHDDQARVVLETRILRQHRRHVYKNSQFFTVTPNILTEAAVEVGPPAGGAAPDRLIEDGDEVRGADPPRIDELLAKLHDSLTTVLGIGRELAPAWDELSRAAGGLFTTVRGLGPPEQLDAIAANTRRALTAAGALWDALAAAEAPERVAALSRELQRALQDLSPQLIQIGQRMDQLEGDLTGITQALGPAEQRRLLDGVRRFRRVIALGQQLTGDIRDLAQLYESGRGTLGGFAHDLQIFDELKEVHREIKRESYKLLIKSPDRGQRNLR